MIDIMKQIKDYIKEIDLINGFIFEMIDTYIKRLIIFSEYNIMQHVRGVAHISHAPRPMGGMINQPKVIGDNGNTGHSSGSVFAGTKLKKIFIKFFSLKF
jgi:hypothetical protein